MEFPKEVDCCVFGTGLVQSLVAAACARVGKSTLHCDKNPYYSGDWAAFSLDDFVALKEKSSANEEQEFGPHLMNIDVWDSGATIPRRRAVIIDLAPKLCFARGKLVQLLVSSNSARYLDFKEVATMYRHDGVLTTVPSTKANLMTNKTISPMEKRRLVKYLQYCLSHVKTLNQQTQTQTQQEDSEKGEEDTLPKQKENAPIPDVSFGELLSKNFKLNANLQEYITSTMTWLPASAPARDGVLKTGLFLSSMEVYCPSPLLYPMYGSSEFPQAFCRVCAVFGGMYMLNQDNLSVTVDEEQSVSHVQVGEYTVAVDKVLGPTTFLKQWVVPNDSNNTSADSQCLLSRATFLYKGDVGTYIKQDSCAGLVSCPPGTCGLTNTCRAIILNSNSGVCPKGYGVCHLSAENLGEGWEEMLESVAKLLFPNAKNANPSKDKHDTQSGEGSEGKEEGEEKDEEQLELCWRVLFQQMGQTETPSPVETTVNNLFACSGLTDATIDFDIAVAEAERLFADMYPNEEFLPRAPDYDEIVFDFDDGTTSTTSNEDDHTQDVDSLENNRIRECTTSFGTTYLPLTAYVKTDNGYVLKSSPAKHTSTATDAMFCTTSFGTRYLPLSAYTRSAEGLLAPTQAHTSPNNQTASYQHTTSFGTQYLDLNAYTRTERGLILTQPSLATLSQSSNA